MAKDYTVEQLNYGRRVYNFMRIDTLAFCISSLLLIASVAVIALKGFNWGLDFTGGTVIEVALQKAPDLTQVREILEADGFKDPLVQNFGSSREIMIRLAPISGTQGSEVGAQVIKVLQQKIDSGAINKSISFVGPSVGKELAQDGAMALLVALICILVYVGFRFEWRLATGAVLALAHDVIITMGVVSLFQLEVDLTIIASLMSVIGYSLNDSIVVSDRIRENFRKIRRGTPYEIMNVSLTQTLSRTLMTSGTTLLVVLMLYIFGGSMLQGFSLVLLIGVFIGTVSSIYIASALALKLGMKREHLLVQQVEKEGADQPSLIR